MNKNKMGQYLSISKLFFGLSLDHVSCKTALRFSSSAAKISVITVVSGRKS